METSIIIWSAVVGLVSILIMARIAALIIHVVFRRHVVSIATEREELFVPGDPTENNSADEDYDD